MTIQEAQQQALAIAEKYRHQNAAQGKETWDASAYMAGFVGDVGDLSKLIMARAGYRDIENHDAKIAHELSDCLWSVLVLAHELGVDLESEFANTMRELDKHLAE
mgnify:CR=1 FL=1